MTCCAASDLASIAWFGHGGVWLPTMESFISQSVYMSEGLRIFHGSPGCDIGMARTEADLWEEVNWVSSQSPRCFSSPHENIIRGNLM